MLKMLQKAWTRPLQYPLTDRDLPVISGCRNAADEGIASTSSLETIREADRRNQMSEARTGSLTPKNCGALLRS